MWCERPTEQVAACSCWPRVDVPEVGEGSGERRGGGDSRRGCVFNRAMLSLRISVGEFHSKVEFGDISPPCFFALVIEGQLMRSCNFFIYLFFG